MFSWLTFFFLDPPSGSRARVFNPAEFYGKPVSREWQIWGLSGGNAPYLIHDDLIDFFSIRIAVVISAQQGGSLIFPLGNQRKMHTWCGWGVGGVGEQSSSHSIINLRVTTRFGPR